MNADPIDAALATQGWAIVDLPDPAVVTAVADRLLEHLRSTVLPDLPSLESYHLFVDDEDRHVAILHELSSFYWTIDLGRTIVMANLDIFRRLLGPDLHIQRYPYLRAVRPSHDKDAVPLHRDTYYGASPYELSIVVPFTNMTHDGVRVVSGSHVAPDSDYPYTQQQSEEVAFRSLRHELGHAWAPRVLDPSLNEHAVAVPVRVGQALIFGLSLVHGGGTNNGPRTRFSTDIRLANSLAPVAWSRGVRPDYFVPLCDSAVSRTGRRYLEANTQNASQRKTT